MEATLLDENNYKDHVMDTRFKLQHKAVAEFKLSFFLSVSKQLLCDGSWFHRQRGHN